MCRSQNPAMAMNKINQCRNRKSPKFQKPHLHTFRHNTNNMSRITGIILNPLQYNKILVLLAFHRILPMSVPLIGIMICDQHPVKSMFFQFGNILIQTHLAVYRSFLYMAVHIYLHKEASFAHILLIIIPHLP